MIGILPSLDRDDLVSSNLSDVDRYTLLNDQIVAARGEDFTLDIEGVERLVCTSKSIAPEAACTGSRDTALRFAVRKPMRLNQ